MTVPYKFLFLNHLLLTLIAIILGTTSSRVRRLALPLLPAVSYKCLMQPDGRREVLREASRIRMYVCMLTRESPCTLSLRSRSI